MLLIPDPVRLGDPRPKFVIDLIGRRQAKRVQMISRRKRLDAAESRMLETSREDEVAIDPLAARGQLRERHANLEGDPRLLRQHAHRTHAFNGCDERIEQRANRRILAGEVMLEIVAAAGVRLIAVREIAAALLTAPERSLHSRHSATLQRATRVVKHAGAALRYDFATRFGRPTNSPPQFGQRCAISLAQLGQNVHS